ncbi:hypothetical protein MUK42_28193 [Musa troglodytarum]|uniref:Uncharacterized protein n=1 Tax=Musa troglodytarum TaxID=320322 RepID=A0A9E7F0A3_9LILI|nr:hypothetical protein MUK42_28193 [Musa troglodytarum]
MTATASHRRKSYGCRHLRPRMRWLISLYVVVYLTREPSEKSLGIPLQCWKWKKKRGLRMRYMNFTRCLSLTTCQRRPRLQQRQRSRHQSRRHRWWRLRPKALTLGVLLSIAWEAMEEDLLSTSYWESSEYVPLPRNSPWILQSLSLRTLPHIHLLLVLSG